MIQAQSNIYSRWSYNTRLLERSPECPTVKLFKSPFNSSKSKFLGPDLQKNWNNILVFKQKYLHLTIVKYIINKYVILIKNCCDEKKIFLPQYLLSPIAELMVQKQNCQIWKTFMLNFIEFVCLLILLLNGFYLCVSKCNGRLTS